MKILLTLFVLLFSSSVFAEDISDFEIEGMSIGDSLLDYFNEEKIQKSIDNFQSTPEYTWVLFGESFKTYDALEITFKTKDKNYIIEGIAGAIYYPNDMINCKQKQTEVKNIFLDLFPLQKPIYDEGIHPLDTSGLSKFYRHAFAVNPSSPYYEIMVNCFDLSKEMEKKGYQDSFNIIIHTNELDDYLHSI